jgi:hypothetical protein
MRDKIVDDVINKYQQRSNVGITKYGTTLETNNKDNFLQHLQEELMDATLYIQKLMHLKEELTVLIKTHPNDADLGEAIRKLIK